MIDVETLNSINCVVWMISKKLTIYYFEKINQKLILEILPFPENSILNVPQNVLGVTFLIPRMRFPVCKTISTNNSNDK